MSRWKEKREKWLDYHSRKAQKNKKGKKGGGNATAKKGKAAMPDEDDLFCAVCNKSFKSPQQLKNHQQSKKHKDASSKITLNSTKNKPFALLSLTYNQNF